VIPRRSQLRSAPIPVLLRASLSSNNSRSLSNRTKASLNTSKTKASLSSTTRASLTTNRINRDLVAISISTTTTTIRVASLISTERSEPVYTSKIY
jgi:hypothetical protein